MRGSVYHQGFTLVELVLTLTLISVGLFGLLTTFEAANRGAIQGQVHQAAIYLGQERLESITADKRFRGYGFIVAGNYPPTENVPVGTHRYTRILSIREVSGADLSTTMEDSGYKRIDVTVSWGVGIQNQIVLSMILGDY